MCARFPTMAGVDSMQLKQILRGSTLSQEYRQTAVCLLQGDMNYIDVGAKMNMDRRTVSRRMKDRILPELEWLNGRTETKSAGA